MIPSIYMERAVSEHRHKLQSEAELERTLAKLHYPCSSWIRRHAGRLGELLVALGSSLKEFEQRGQQAIYDL